MNPIFESILKSRNGNYCHVVEVECLYSLKSIIECLYDEFINDYSFENVKDFIASLEIYHLESDELSNEENDLQETLIYDFNIESYLNELHGV